MPLKKRLAHRWLLRHSSRAWTYLEGKFEDGGGDSKQKSEDRSTAALLRPPEVWMELSEGRRTNQK